MSKIAIPVWEEQVSTVFDFADTLLVVKMESSREISRTGVPLASEAPVRKAKRLRDLGVSVVICGAVSRPLITAVGRTGIQVIPFVSGAVDEVLAAYMTGQLMSHRFLLPGCRSGARRRWRHGWGTRDGRW